MKIFSTSAPAKSGSAQIVEAINKTLSVHTLSPEDDAKYKELYLAARQRKVFEQLGAFTAATVLRINTAYDLLNYIVINAGAFEDMVDSDPDVFASRISTYLQKATTTIGAQLGAKLPKEVKAVLSQNLGAYAGITIEKSTRYAGGRDIIQSGTPVATSSNAALGNFEIFSSGGTRITHSNDGAFQEDMVRVYSAEIAQNAVRAGEQLHEAIFGAKRGTGDAMFAAKSIRIPLKFNWSQLNGILQAIHPSLAGIQIDLFEDLDKAVVKALGGFLSLGLRSVPSRAIVMMKVRTMKHGGKDLDINPISQSIDVKAEGGLILSLKKEFVDHISQGDESLATLCLYRWYQAWASYYMSVSNSTGKGIKNPRQIPRYVTSATSIPKLKELRKEFGYAVTDTASDENEITIMPNGLPAVLPKREDIDVNTVKEFEDQLNTVLESLYEKGIPFSDSHDTLRSDLFIVRENDLDIDKTMQTQAKSLARFRGMCLGIDPDFATIVSTNQTNTGIRDQRIIGAKAPTALDTADILGYDFAEAGEAPNFRSSSEAIRAIASSVTTAYPSSQELLHLVAPAEAGNGKIISTANSDGKIYVEGGSGSGTSEILTIIADVCAAYGYLQGKKLVPAMGELIKRAKAASGYGDDDSLQDSEFDRSIYNGLIEPNFSFNDSTLVDRLLIRIMIRTLNDAAGLRGSNLLTSLINETGSINAAAEALEDQPHYFKIGTGGKLADIGHLVNYFGGSVFREACLAMLAADRKKVYSSLAAGEEAPNSTRLQNIILPFAAIYGKCAPEAMEIFAAAEEEVERLKPDDGIDASDVQFPGLKEGVSLLPHQLAAHKTLRRRPRYATIFIAPGGGKTIIGITDIGCMMKELNDLGQEQIRPLIICPTNLVGDWCNELHKIANGWNAVPITSDTVSTWGEERLYDVVSQAPVNTIFVVGLSFLSTGSMDVDIGGTRVKIRGAVEFVKRFNFSYVLLDESHKVKNYQGGQQGSAVHFNTKAVFTVPTIRYARLATGTLVTDRVSDVVGQAALLTPTIFGDSLDNVDKGEGPLATIRRAHSRLSNHTAFISFKRKHWAFMLPNPIDTFIPVDIAEPTVPNSDLHQQVYNALYQQLFDMLDDLAKDAKNKNGDGEDEEGGETNSDDGDIDPEELEEGDVLGKLLAQNADLNMYFQRMEMLLTDPMGDEIARETFDKAGVKNFVSAKVLAIIDRIRKHFEVQATRLPELREHQIFNWQAGVVPRELDIAVYEGKKYMARKQSEGAQRLDLPPSMTPPPQDPDYWKEELQGKLIVFTRYTRAANAIFNALPENYKKVAVLFHGEVAKLGQDKVANLDAFKSDPKVQILIANEQAISEGHNMQMGSRIIRCDTPWSPGTYDQSTARIFRPDVSAATLDENGKPGDMPREIVFIDWIMTDKTLEVGKVARLMWKTLEKTQFDEKGNELYEPLDAYELAPIRMNASLLIDNNTMGDFADYFEAKSELNSIETKEFSDMRKSTVAKMVSLEPAQPLADFALLEQCPIVANQRIPDRNNWGLIRLLDWTKNHEFVEGEALKLSLHRVPCVTEFGNGVIVGITVRNVDGKLRQDSPISTVKVRLSGTDELVVIPATKIHIAENVSPKDLERFFKINKPWANETERKRATAAANRKQADDQIEDQVETQNTRKTREKIPKVEREAARQEKRVENKREGKPINDGVKQAANTVREAKAPLPKLDNKVKPMAKPVAREVAKATKTDMAFDLTPTVYNGFIALYADVTDPDTKMLKEQEFVEFGAYVYIDFFYYSDFDLFLDYIEKKYEFDNATAKRLEHVMDAFSATGRMTFNQRQAVKVQSDLKQFFLVRHRAATDKKHIKVYPMVMEDRLRLMIDINTNPMANKLVGKKIANTRKFGTFEKSEGMWIGFVNTVPKAKARINKIVKAGYAVTNLKACLKALDKIKATKDKSKAL